MNHDPLCLLHPSDYPMNAAGMCSCPLIARVRADERRHIEMAAVIDREVIEDTLRAQIEKERDESSAS